jgi:creatinine amidohydrolase
MQKYKLWDMSWREAEEAFKRSDTVILPTGTLHAHGPTPIGIDASAPDRLADEVGKRTGLLTLPVVTYGEDAKMERYPGSMAIDAHILELYYTDICRSLRRNGIRKVVVINGHGGNREALIRTGRNIRKFGMLLAILEWWVTGVKAMPEVFTKETIWLDEFCIGVAIHGKENVDTTPKVHMGEWGENPTKDIYGSKIKAVSFNDVDFQGGPVVIPIDAWDIDIASPPEIKKEDLDTYLSKGNNMITQMADYIAEFAKEFERVDVDKIFEKDQDF